MLSSSSTTRTVRGLTAMRRASVAVTSHGGPSARSNIGRVNQGVAGGQREGYAAAVTDLWKRLARALSELETIAADPDELLDDSLLERLPRLQYALHAAAALALGLRPPAGA